MARVCLVDRGIGRETLLTLLHERGAKNIRDLRSIGMVVCDLTDKDIAYFRGLRGVIVKLGADAPVVKVQKEVLPLGPEAYSMLHSGVGTMFYNLRDSFTPPLLGTGYTAIVMDSGIRKTHTSLKDKIVYEKDFTGSPYGPDDKLGHGTGVSHVLAGGYHAVGVESGFAPGAKIINLKVISDDGVGVLENVLAGIDEAVRLIEDARAKGLPYRDPMRPNAVNISWGVKDTGDPEDPLRLATAKLVEVPMSQVICAAGNFGPASGTITLPASVPGTYAFGALTFPPPPPIGEIWEKSSRGPTVLEKIVKPEFVFYGVNLVVARAVDDYSYGIGTGTSLSAPMGSGGWGLVYELGFRYLPDEVLEALAVPELWHEIIWPSVCRKPPGYPVGVKDNFYGWGLPMGDLVVRFAKEFERRVAPDWMSILFGGVVSVGMIGMLADIFRRLKIS